MAEQEDLPYTSPARKLIRFFRNSRDGWKAKHQEAKATIKRLENRERFLQKSKDQWKAKVRDLETENAQLKAQLEQMKEQQQAQAKKKASKYLRRVHRASLFRFVAPPFLQRGSDEYVCAASSVGAGRPARGGGRLADYAGLFPLPQAIPSWSSSRLWLLRVGYYKLIRKKEIASDWVWIVDFTIQAGDLKCLAIVGVRLSHWMQQRSQRSNPALGHQDVEPIELVPVRQSNGEWVYQQLKEAVYKTGVPRQIIADEGTDVKAGINQFIQKYPQTASIYDVKHFTARLLERQFKSDPMWVEFTRWAQDTKSQLHQTDLSYLEPPNQRSKSRYMNMETLVDWGSKGLAFLDRLEAHVCPKSEKIAIQHKLDWLFQFREALLEWQEIMGLVETTETFVRKEGFSQGCDQKLRSLLRLSPGATERTCRIRWALIEYVLDASLLALPQERLLGSSEVIESIFGKFKYMQHEHQKGNLTGMVLAIPAMASKTTQDVIRKAMETVPVQDVRAWMKKMFGRSAHTKRKEAFSALVCLEQKSDQLPLSA